MKRNNWIALAILGTVVTALLVWWGWHSKLTAIAQRSEERQALLAECKQHIAFLEGAGSFFQLVNDKLGRDPVTTAQLAEFLNESFANSGENSNKRTRRLISIWASPLAMTSLCSGS